MPKKVKKTFGENPESVGVLDVQVQFDENGEAVVEDHIAEILDEIPGYDVEAEEEEPTSEEDEIVEESVDEEPSEEDNGEEDSEDASEEEEVVEEVVEEAPVAPTRKPRRPGAKK